MHGSLSGSIDTSEGSKEYSVVTYSSLLRNEVLGTAIEVCPSKSSSSSCQLPFCQPAGCLFCFVNPKEILI